MLHRAASGPGRTAGAHGRYTGEVLGSAGSGIVATAKREDLATAKTTFAASSPDARRRTLPGRGPICGERGAVIDGEAHLSGEWS
jgi:hypothetical protein